MPTEHFKSKEAYRKNMAYRHIHGIPFTAENVVVGGQEHKVKHSGRSEDKGRNSVYRAAYAERKGGK